MLKFTPSIEIKNFQFLILQNSMTQNSRLTFNWKIPIKLLAKKFTLLIFFVFITSINSFSKGNEFSELREQVKKLETEHVIQQNQLNNMSLMYQATNDRLNNYLTYTGIVASVFGILIALAGIYIGFQSFKSQNKIKQAIRTLEEAKAYVEGKKTEFDSEIASKKAIIDDDYKKILNLIRDKLLSDIEVETTKVKEMAEKKTEEIANFSVSGNSEKALTLLEKRLEFFENIGIPDDPDILLSKAQILREKGMVTESIELLEKIIEKKPDHNLAYFYLGYDYAELNDSLKSILNYKRHLSIEPNSAGAHNNIALQFKVENKLLEALEHLDLALAINPESERYNLNKIAILLKLNSISKIIETYKKLVSIKPNEQNYFSQLIKYLTQENRNIEVIEYYDQAIENFKDSDQEISNDFVFQRAGFIGKTGRKEDAVDIYQALINDGYKVEHCYINIADLKNELGDRESAIAILDNGISSNPLSSVLYVKKAYIESGNNVEKAKEILLIGGRKINNEVYYLRGGRFFRERDLFDLAQFCYHEALKQMKIKLLLEQKEEGNMMNYYETCIILGLEVETFNTNYRNYILSEKYIIVLNVLDILLEISKDFSEETRVRTIKKIKDLNIEAKDVKESNWNYKDIQLYFSKEYGEEPTAFVDKIIKYIHKEITINEI